MANFTVDTNVFVVASTVAPDSRPDVTHVSPEESRRVFEWVKEFHVDDDSFIVLDLSWKIWNEYMANLGEQDYGYVVVREKLSHQRTNMHAIFLDHNGNAILPNSLDTVIHDLSDKKFVAVALAESPGAVVVNAVDSDWQVWVVDLMTHGVQVLQLLP